MVKNYEDYIGLAFSAAQKFTVTPELYEEIRADGLARDYRQEVLTAIVEYLSNGGDIDKDQKAFFRFVNRKIYRFLVNYGYKRRRNSPKFTRPEKTFTEYFKEDNNNARLEHSTLLSTERKESEEW